MTLLEKLRTKAIDPRYLQLISLATYSIAAREIFHFERSHWVTALCVLAEAATDFTIGKLYYQVTRFPLSGVIVGFTASLLLDSRFWWAYVLCAVMGILSKAFIKVNGRHIYNPGNFGVVFVLQLVPWLAAGMPALFSGAFWVSVAFFFLGGFVAWYAGQLLTSVSWLVFFVLFAILRSAASGASLLYLCYPLLAPTTLLFTFHMITDPSTTPQTSHRARIIYVFVIALIDAGFRYYEIPYGNFYALFIATSVLPVLRVELARDPWNRERWLKIVS